MNCKSCQCLTGNKDFCGQCLELIEGHWGQVYMNKVTGSVDSIDGWNIPEPEFDDGIQLVEVVWDEDEERWVENG